MSEEKDNSKRLPSSLTRETNLTSAKTETSSEEPKQSEKAKLSLLGPEIDQRDKNELQVGAFEVKNTKENNTKLSAKLQRSKNDSTTAKRETDTLHTGPEIVDQSDFHRLQVGAHEVKTLNPKLSKKMANQPSIESSNSSKEDKNKLASSGPEIDTRDRNDLRVGAFAATNIHSPSLDKKMANQPSIESSNSSKEDKKIKLSSSGPEIDTRDRNDLRVGAFAATNIQSPSLDDKMENQPSSSNSSKDHLSSSGPEIDTTDIDEIRRQQRQQQQEDANRNSNLSEKMESNDNNNDGGSEKKQDPATHIDKNIDTFNNDTITSHKEADQDQILTAEVKEITPEMKEALERKEKPENNGNDDTNKSVCQSFIRRPKLFFGITLLIIIIVVTVVVVIIVTQNKNGGTSPTTMPTPSPTPVVTTTPTVAFTSPPTNIIDYPMGPPTSSTSSWTPTGSTISGSRVNDRFGRFLSMNYNGTIMATAAPAFDDEEKSQIGSVQIFQLQATSTTTDWIPKGAILTGINQGDQFGSSVSLSGDGKVVAIRSSVTGTVKIFHYQRISENTTLEEDWVPKGQDLVGEKNGDDFGNSLSFNEYGNVLLIGAKEYTSNDGISSIGMAIVYQFDTERGRWEQLGDAIYGDSESDMTGSSVSISASGTRIVIGDLNNDCCGVSNGGRVRIFDLNGTKKWLLSGTLSGTVSKEQMGYCALSGNGLIVAVGSPSIGKIQVYENVAFGKWKKVGQDIQQQGDAIGAIISLSYDGRRLAYGAPINDSYRGYTKVSEYNTTTFVWEQVGETLAGSQENVNFGSSVALSANGYRLAIGAEYDFATGSVTIYEY